MSKDVAEIETLDLNGVCWPLEGTAAMGMADLLPPAITGARIMPIRTYLEDYHAFQPDEIATLSRALDETCKALNINGDARLRDTIAARIIDLARNGVLDATALSERVVAESKAMRKL